MSMTKAGERKTMKYMEIKFVFDLKENQFRNKPNFEHTTRRSLFTGKRQTFLSSSLHFNYFSSRKYCQNNKKI